MRDRFAPRKMVTSPEPEVCDMNHSISALFAAIWIGFSGTAGFAQAAEKPADSFGKRGLGLSQASGFRDLNAFRPGANYEPMRRYALSPRLGLLINYVGYLDIKTSGSKSLQCTATLLSATRLLTNAHCIPTEGRERATSIIFTLGYLAVNDASTERDFQVSPTAIIRNSDLDFAVLELIAPVPDFIDPQWRVRPARIGEPLLVVGHPLMQPLHVTQAGCTMAPNTPSNATELYHVCDTESGHSGSPILSADDPHQIVGLHKEWTSDANRAIQISALDWEDIIAGPAVSSLPRNTAAAPRPAGDQQTIESPPLLGSADYKPITVSQRADRFSFAFEMVQLKRDASGCTHRSNGRHIEELDQLIRTYLPQTRQGHIIVEGHSDSQGAAAINQKCSKIFAQSILNTLRGTGVLDNAGAVQVIGYGEERPIASNLTAAGRAQNNRIVVSLLY